MPAAADYMKGRLHINQLEWGPAAQLFERSLTQMSGQRQPVVPGEPLPRPVLRAARRTRPDVQRLQARHRRGPDRGARHPRPGAARWAQGQLDEALAHYQRAMQQKAVPPAAWLDIARPRDPDPGAEPEAQLGRGRGGPGGRRPRCSRRTHLDSSCCRPELALRKDEVDEAAEDPDRRPREAPAEPEFLTALVDIALRGENKPRAEELLEEGKKTLPDSVALRLSFARVFAAIKGKETVVKIQLSAKGGDKFTEEDRGRLLSGLADTLFRADAPKEARALWQALTELPRTQGRPPPPHAPVRPGDEGYPTPTACSETLDDIAQIEQANGAYHRYGEALLLIWQARTTPGGAADRRLARRPAATSTPCWRSGPTGRPSSSPAPRSPRLNGAPEQAIKDLQEARKNGDNSPSVVRKLVTLLTKAGRDGEAQLMLAALQASLLHNTELGRLAVTVRAASRRDGPGRRADAPGRPRGHAATRGSWCGWPR